jgi:hypothetical protein
METSDPFDAVSNPWRVDPCGVIAVEQACKDEPRLRGCNEVLRRKEPLLPGRLALDGHQTV